MYQKLEERLRALDNAGVLDALRGSRVGLEKESLRVTPEGRLSQRPHPSVLGSALTHPWITTDYAESLLELITPPQEHSAQALDFLFDIETFVYQRLGDELLWTTSMPCIIGGEDDVRIAEYGSSNAGRMKHVYRQGLAWRYGKIMQVIAGVHFNHSIAEGFWPVWQELEGQSSISLRAFRDTGYMGLTRNIQRYGWLVIYLLGTSPAICRTFLAGRKPSASMKSFNETTLYEPYGTSLRMGNIGYTNSKEHETGIQVSYDSLDGYVASLTRAISQLSPDYERIGVKVDGVYRQLNANLLQIENEYYSTVRPKQLLQGLEKPVHALAERGIRYIELRSVDVNAFHPAGITQRQLAFLEVFMHFCLLQENQRLHCEEKRSVDHNQYLVAHQGRDPALRLEWQGRQWLMSDWAREILGAMQGVAAVMDSVHETARFSDAVRRALELVNHPDMTPSARMLEAMHEHGQESFFQFAWRQSMANREFFLQRQLDAGKQQEFAALAQQSLEQQQALEHAEQPDFDRFLQDYFEGRL
ncbi:MAG: glutamate--cysteine ligase [Thiothrix sp.]|nr:glutamate--cysteine ligase [Thiothrix sp.]HPQ94228.1 glutamate--cysteine ligase [Thiolinea sp.]